MSGSSKLALVSLYQSQPVLGGRVIELELELDDHGEGYMKGRARIDPNTCTLDLWGDRGVCTRIAVREEEVEATAMSTVDEPGLGRVPWRLAIAGSKEMANLIEYPGAGLWYLTVAGEDGGIAVVPLFDARLFAPRC